jgi:hypothetical protein
VRGELLPHSRRASHRTIGRSRPGRCSTPSNSQAERPARTARSRVRVDTARPLVIHPDAHERRSTARERIASASRAHRERIASASRAHRERIASASQVGTFRLSRTGVMNGLALSALCSSEVSGTRQGRRMSHHCAHRGVTQEWHPTLPGEPVVRCHPPRCRSGCQERLAMAPRGDRAAVQQEAPRGRVSTDMRAATRSRACSVARR